MSQTSSSPRALNQPPRYAPQPGAIRTKIIATYGPACAETETLLELAQRVDVFRVNLAHGSREEHANAVEAIRQVSSELHKPLAILVDLSGPKIRLGKLHENKIRLEKGQTVRFVRNAPQDRLEFETTYERLVDELEIGDTVLLADGAVALTVVDKTEDALACHVDQGGTVRSKQGVNLPGAKLSAKALGPEDRSNAEWSVEVGVDFIGLSFVRSPDEVRELKDLLLQHDADCHVIAKIEKPEALESLEEIVSVADGVMVARGDLGVEIDLAKVPVVQKEIVNVCNRYQKPVIIATQMLDSMQRSSAPTRAEVTDVANAILDGADACMLSGETAIGEHPLEAVKMLRRIAQNTESLYRHRPRLPASKQRLEGVHQVTGAVVYGADHIASQLDAKLLVVASHTGKTALALSKRRSFVPIVGISDTPTILRKMCLYWGVIPIEGAPANLIADLVAYIDFWGEKYKVLEPGDQVVLVTGAGLVAAGHNVVIVHEVSPV